MQLVQIALVNLIDSILYLMRVNFLTKSKIKFFKEQLKDYYLNCQFRRDIYVKGARAITYKQAMDRLMNTHFILTNLSKILKIKFNVP